MRAMSSIVEGTGVRQVSVGTGDKLSEVSALSFVCAMHLFLLTHSQQHCKKTVVGDFSAGQPFAFRFQKKIEKKNSKEYPKCFFK